MRDKQFWWTREGQLAVQQKDGNVHGNFVCAVLGERRVVPLHSEYLDSYILVKISQYFSVTKIIAQNLDLWAICTNRASWLTRFNKTLPKLK